MDGHWRFYSEASFVFSCHNVKPLETMARKQDKLVHWVLSCSTRLLHVFYYREAVNCVHLVSQVAISAQFNARMKTNGPKGVLE